MYELGWNNKQIARADGTGCFNLMKDGFVVGGILSESLGKEIVEALNLAEAKKAAAKQVDEDMWERENWFVYDHYPAGASMVTQIPRRAIAQLERMNVIAPLPSKGIGHWVAINEFTLAEIEVLAGVR